MMNRLPGIDKQEITIISLDDTEEEKNYWLSKSPEERLRALEVNRRMVYGEDKVTSRLQRILEFVKQA